MLRILLNYPEGPIESVGNSCGILGVIGRKICKNDYISIIDGPLESRLASYNVTTSLQLVMKKENSVNPGENHQIQPLSRKTSNLTRYDYGVEKYHKKSF